MKFIITLVLSLITYFISDESKFPLDEHGKFTFQEVVEVPGMSRDLLYKNGEEFVKEIKVLNIKKNHLIKDKENYKLINKGSFYVYQLGSVKKAIDGAVEYDFILEIKDGKYRYTITNFIFNEYQRNRYGKFEPVNGKYFPLEMKMTSLNKKEWEKHRNIVYEKTQELIHNLNSEMIYVENQKNKKKVVNENW